MMLLRHALMEMGEAEKSINQFLYNPESEQHMLCGVTEKDCDSPVKKMMNAS